MGERGNRYVHLGGSKELKGAQKLDLPREKPRCLLGDAKNEIGPHAHATFDASSGGAPKTGCSPGGFV